MIPREILKKVKRIEITTRGLVNDVFSGDQTTDERENGAAAPDRHIRECWQTSKVVQQEGVKVRHIGRACRETKGLISLTPLSRQIVDAP